MRKRWILIFQATCLAPPVCAQIVWTPYEGNPVITPSFDTESLAMYRPSVVKWKGHYHLWYGKLWQQTRWIAYTRSEDGLAWDNSPPQGFDNAVIGPSGDENAFDEFEATHGSVIVDGDTLKMWYSGGGRDGSSIGFAWSLDGTTWTKEAGPAGGGSVLDAETDGAGAQVLTFPTATKVDDTYHLYYVRYYPAASILGYETRLGYARSSDGLNWAVVAGSGTNGAVVDLGESGAFDEYAVQWPAVLHNGTEFELWYQGLGRAFDQVVPRIGCARSNDGVSWQKIPDPSSEAGECFRSLAQPAVILDDDVYKMWYTLSASGQSGDVVQYATSQKTGTGVEDNEAPASVGPLLIYPNPAPSEVRMIFSLTDPARLHLEIHDVLGRNLDRIDLGRPGPGEHRVVWGGVDAGGNRLPTGAYILTLHNLDTGVRSPGEIVHIVR